jgi:uncharacterized membrane protein
MFLSFFKRVLKSGVMFWLWLVLVGFNLFNLLFLGPIFSVLNLIPLFFFFYSVYFLVDAWKKDNEKLSYTELNVL